MARTRYDRYHHAALILAVCITAFCAGLTGNLLSSLSIEDFWHPSTLKEANH